MTKYDEEMLDTVEMIVNKLLSSFQKVSELDDSEPVMENTETVYAGLTYQKGALNETAYYDNMSNRGYTV